MGGSWLTNVAGIVLLVLIIGWMLDDGEPEDVRVLVTVPQLSETALRGQRAFNDTCAECHGENGAGSTAGPPLIDPIYRPSHHADGAFNIAIASGVRQHHWKFGSMPPQPDFDLADLPALVIFIREVQKANKIN